MKRLIPWAIVPCVMVFLAAGETPATKPATQPDAESAGVAADDVSVSILLKRATLSADEEPELIVRFKNVGKEGYRNLYDVGAYWKWSIQLMPVDPKAGEEPGPWELHMNANGHGPNIEHRQIKPGETTDVVLDLNDPPFTFDYKYAGIIKHLVAPVRHLPPGRYGVYATVSLTPPFGPGNSEWSGPITTAPIDLIVTEAKLKAVTKEEVEAYDAAIDKQTAKMPDNGLWMNGISPSIDLPKEAALEDVIDQAVNNSGLESKAYRILRSKAFMHADMPDLRGTAALVQVGKSYKVVVVFPTGDRSWWSRFYDADFTPPVTSPAATTKP